MDNTGPTVVSINCVGSTLTGASSVQFAVTFSEPVTGVALADFALATTNKGNGTISSISGSGATYTVTVSSVVGDGTLGLNLASDGAIADVAGNPLRRAPSPVRSTRSKPGHPRQPLATEQPPEPPASTRLR